MISFVNFARIASICVGFHLGTLHGYFFHQDFWPNLNFLLEDQIKLVLTRMLFVSAVFYWFCTLRDILVTIWTSLTGHSQLHRIRIILVTVLL